MNHALAAAPILLELQWAAGDTHLPTLVGALAVGILMPLLLLLPVYYRGRARRRAGKPPGWEGEGWSLGHVWLAFALLIVAELVVFYVMQPELFDRLLSGRPPSPIELTDDAPGLGRQLLWTTLAVSGAVLFIVPLAPVRILWTKHWSPRQCIAAALLAFLALRALMLVLLPALPEITSSEHPQRELAESVAQLGNDQLWLMVLVVAVLAPFVEEVLFRGVLLTGLARQISFGSANLIQAALFATLHLSSSLFPFFLVMGIVSGLMVRRSGGLLASILLHALNNATAVAALWWLGR